MAFTWTPEDGTLAAADDAARSARYASSRNWIISGMSLSAGTGLNVAVSAGSAWIAGYYVEWDAASEQAVAASNTNHVYVELTRDMAGNVTAVGFEINTTGTPPSGDYIKLGTATTDGSSVTGTATTGRSPEVQADPVPENAQDIAYDNTASGMAATNVKTALDELAARPTSGGWDAFIYKASDQSRIGNGQTTLNDDDALFFEMAANRTYFIEITLVLFPQTSNGTKIRLNCPTATSGEAHIHKLTYTSNATSVFDTLQDQSVNTDINTAIINSAKALCTIQCIVANGGTAGNFTLQWAMQSTGNGGTLTVKNLSTLKYKDVT